MADDDVVLRQLAESPQRAGTVRRFEDEVASTSVYGQTEVTRTQNSCLTCAIRCAPSPARTWGRMKRAARGLPAQAAIRSQLPLASHTGGDNGGISDCIPRRPGCTSPSVPSPYTMPGTTTPSVPHYEPAPLTRQDLDWAELPVIDISKAKTLEGRIELAPVVRDAMQTHGFMFIVNHGLSEAENERMTDIADVAFVRVSEEEKKRFEGKIKEEGSWMGYKLRQFWTIDNDVRDQIEHYNMHRHVFQQGHPEALQPFLPELWAFSEHNFYNVLQPVLQLLALGLELPEDTFVNLFNFDAQGDTYLCFMKYYPRTEDDEVRTKNVWMKGHTDIDAISMLWSQPVTALQVLSSDGKWRYVKHIPNSIIVNAGDTMEMLSGGYYRAAVHRVFQPPADQRGYTRLGLYYFGYPDDGVRLAPFKESPVLQRVGITRKCADEDAPTAREWRVARVKAYGLSDSERKDDTVEEQVINGLVVRHYN